MTAFARAELGCVVWEIRSVNHRYLDVSFRLPDNFRRLEAELKSTFKNRVHRGKLECNLNVKAAALNAGLSVNEELVSELKRAMTRVSELSGLEANSDALALMRWPDVLVNTEVSEELDGDVLNCFEAAVVALTAMREREGQELSDLIETRLKDVESIVCDVTDAAPRIEAAQHEKLLGRLEKLNVESDPARLEQELVILAQKHDVMEELDRLTTHVTEVRRNLNSTEPVGRRLDFLMQELNREANTLSSKAMVSETTLHAVDLKVAIEQMREQVQNIE
jgi:uncharacterized protein (TIGR00255 family)